MSASVHVRLFVFVGVCVFTYRLEKYILKSMRDWLTCAGCHSNVLGEMYMGASLLFGI